MTRGPETSEAPHTSRPVSAAEKVGWIIFGTGGLLELGAILLDAPNHFTAAGIMLCGASVVGVAEATQKKTPQA